MLILGIETSCDETSAAVVENGKKIISENIYSQTDIHCEYGGVVPEIAARKHIDTIFPLIDRTLKKADKTLNDIDAIAVTSEPGLIGALLVGVSTAKSVAYALNKPLISVNHILGHLYAANLEFEIEYPVIGLIISGGHTLLVKSESYTDYEIIGTTLDDAVGESFDKVAKMLELGYPGGPVVEKLAKNGDPDSIEFPKPMINKDNLDFSFSGLKTAVMYYIRKNQDYNIPDICASFQKSVFEILLVKSQKALKKYGIRNFVVGGGVAANKTLKEFFKNNMKNTDIYIPSIKFCTDNASMIAGVAYHMMNKNESFDLCLNPVARIQL